MYLLTYAHPISTMSHIQVSGKKVRTVCMGRASNMEGLGAAITPPIPGAAATLCSYARAIGPPEIKPEVMPSELQFDYWEI